MLHLICSINIFDVFFLIRAGIEPPTDKKIWIERKIPLTEEEKNEPVDRPFQYVGKFNSIFSIFVFFSTD